MRILLSLVLLAAGFYAQAQIDTINASNHRLQTERLTEGTARYLVYNVDSITGITGTADVWERSVSFGVLPGNPQPVVMFEWKWFHNESFFRHVKAVADRKTLAPVSEIVLFKGYAFAGYKFTNGFLIPDSTVAHNRVNKAMKVPLNPPVLNWEWDMETFSTLPINRVGQKFAIAFMDPNSPQPAYYLYEISGEDNLPLNKEVSIKCWKLHINYGNGAYATFWISQQSREVLKMKEYFNGSYRYKVKLY
ncbi:hypothetical protein [Pseudobacter ginsenosidimutans]|uniref:Uncharacterized protein n=1 Tax=Pseudobacter ginsenosidimutans TaxID=661488 RepID=A0A4Q7MXI7_9BACT|nr:hypothetical protein [Pseudobacter ginsenosidimutans]QEC41313.1 hypothetical protein FSB84_06255 [Pseudobacter ginsenosidimutans]RZS71913.1 hypothetical protein EV199_3826 [Pseudobacter ginsenosidimutans]